jgi:hypothetical protein
MQEGLRKIRGCVNIANEVLLPPNPVAKPTVPSEPSISTQKEPRTLMPQLVLEARYFSHRDIGVDIGVSINLEEYQHQSLKSRLGTYQWPPLTLW